MAILGEQKTAKFIAMQEEMRRYGTTLHNWVNDEALAMSVPADPQAVLDAIKDTEQVSDVELGIQEIGSPNTVEEVLDPTASDGGKQRKGRDREKARLSMHPSHGSGVDAPIREGKSTCCNQD